MLFDSCRKVLDIEEGVQENGPLITYPKHGYTNQLWYINANGTIECPEQSLVVSALKSEFEAGTPVIAALKKDGDDQKFELDYP